MGRIIRTDSSNTDFRALVALLDEDLALRDGEDNAFYAQFNGIAVLKHCVVYYENGIALGCGALKRFDANSMEVKGMFVNPEVRGKGIASLLLVALENWAKELGYEQCVLETGLRQPEAIALYKKNKYNIIPNYPPYEGVANSVCFRKVL
ncbi:GNAT family N-acetyltransferase [Maribacter sp. 4U21]|uniref:GNAT family N-acetyltransferase n=1 Tax=Maribacter sp. 4U21 TaxID=1889779 RepID=UPI000C15E1B0|nr:GNAT family N-acetyltransferase [Maribacter sp. 4U21]PIB23856.1 GNAT family N-acetyltransferase [Maribacter sp. 4U21]